MELIPAIDLRAGRVVRLQQGDFSRETVYDADPAGVAARLIEQGATRLHLVDLDGARDGGAPNDPAIREILERIRGLPVQMGGGVRSTRRAEELFAAGVDRVVLGTVALEAPEVVEELAERFPRRVIVGLDSRDGRIAVRGWLDGSSAEPGEVAARFEGLPLGGFLYTDISRDGMLVGPNVEETARLARATRHAVIASGGIGTVDDLIRLARSRVIAAAVIGRAIYDGRIDLRDALEKVAAC